MDNRKDLHLNPALLYVHFEEGKRLQMVAAPLRALYCSRGHS